ncbi:hypothetical protein FisN_14Hu208 [Fistulifera solaris]|uniref:Transmembrane protein 222 n=1 Tax=Fistulifera solaris TaxID=1519565 RepID=A0A1Z5K8K9_FISSO|nr:hypothetical protein FisN_14Hu208 [Fistulifera solaris]|eukprot:GAX22579.1 hypothetical protein FisN_14Hu208 [Fistulifera solaris]
MNHHAINATAAFSYSIVWTPLPFITWIFPFIGHTGMADSKGIISDFQGPYFVGDRGHMAFGAPTKVLKIRFIEEDNTEFCHASQWDEAIQEANAVYRGRMHNLFCDNCHSHVAYALNRMAVKDYGVEKWDMVKIAVLIFFRGRFVSWGAMFQSWGPFLVIVMLIWLMRRWGNK